MVNNMQKIYKTPQIETFSFQNLDTLNLSKYDVFDYVGEDEDWGF